MLPMCHLAQQAGCSMELNNTTVPDTLQLSGRVCGFECCGEDDRVLDRHACALAKVRSHRVCCIANEQPGPHSPNRFCQLFQIMVKQRGFGERVEHKRDCA